MEYGCSVAGAKLIVIMGHSMCGAVASTVNLVSQQTNALKFTGCDNLDTIIRPIANIVDKEKSAGTKIDGANQALIDRISLINVFETMKKVRANSDKLNSLIEEGKVMLIGAFYDVKTGKVQFYGDSPSDKL
jgi:carbonic anhydrase/SulP family sulfate permease